MICYFIQVIRSTLSNGVIFKDAHAEQAIGAHNLLSIAVTATKEDAQYIFLSWHGSGELVDLPVEVGRVKVCRVQRVLLFTRRV
jgi:hypothetical protein